VAGVRHLPCAKATDLTSAETSDAATAEATDVSSTEPTHVATAESAHVSSAASAASAATAGFCTRGKQAAGQHGACQNHHHSSSHDILHWDGRTFPPQDWVRRWRVSQQANADVAMDCRWEYWLVVSTKFSFSQLN
jgi:hypothetical protein